GDEILDGVKALLESERFGVRVATQDWHPADHLSFASSHEGREERDVIDLHGHEQILWPDHCVQDTPGAELAVDLPWERVMAIVRKGTDREVDSYSAFRNNWDPAGERPKTGLAGYLRERGIEHVVVCGLARDFCVKWSAEDAADEGFDVTVVWDVTRPVDPSSNEKVRKDLEEAGARIVDLDDLGIE
ncbi:MAG: nicotinamidase, partial [Gemmatimonadetes bacterium]|nr:nicotinamidase [Gemmatimonadota bacterium]